LLKNSSLTQFIVVGLLQIIITVTQRFTDKRIFIYCTYFKIGCIEFIQRLLNYISL